MSGALTYRLVVVDPDGATFTPGDVSIGTDHYWVTSQRRVGHAHIESPPSGEGQSIDPVTGAVTDAEYRVRVIDIPELGCTMTPLVNDDLRGDLILSQGWEFRGVGPDGSGGIGQGYGFAPGATDATTYGGWWDYIGGPFPLSDPTVRVAGFAFGTWNDDGMLGNYAPLIRSTWLQKTFSGFQPYQRVGMSMLAEWTLDTGAGNVFFEVGGTRTSFPNNAFDLGSVDVTLPHAYQGYAAGYADANGDVLVAFGLENYAINSNVNCLFRNLYLAECVPDVSGIGTGDYYTTSWLADASARQQLLGRRAYVEQSFDGGATWSMLMAGYVTSLQMQDSLVYEFSIGDSRRVERTRGAWRDLDPVAEPDFSSVTALLGGPVYGGLLPYSPRYALPRFRVVDYQLASGNRPASEPPDGWVRLNYEDGPMPPGFKHAGTQHSVSLTRRTLNDRAQEYYDAEQTWSADFPAGAFPGLKGWLFDPATGTQAYSTADFVPVGQNFTELQTYFVGTSGGTRQFVLAKGQEFINSGLEIVLRHDLVAPTAINIGDYYHVLVAPRAVSDTFPLYVRAHPVDLEAALLARHGVPVDSASVTTTRAALGEDLVAVLRFTDPNQTVQAVCDTLHAAFGYTTRLDATGAREFVVYRQAVDSTPSLAIATNDLRAEGGPTFDLHERSRRNRLVLEQQFFRTISFDDEAVLGRPDAIEPVTGTATFDYSTDGGATLDADVQGPLEQRVTLNGHAAWRGYVNDVVEPDATTPMSQLQRGAGLARALFAATGRGAQEATVVTRRDAADADAAQLADPVALDADHVPNAQLGQTPVAQRGGTRWWRVTRRTEDPEGAVLQLTDANTGVPYGEVVTLRVLPDLYEPDDFIRLEITGASTLLADSAWLDVECALGSSAPTGRGVHYTTLDALQFTDALGAATEPFVTRLGPFPSRTAVWVRARGVLVGGAPGTWSAWTSLGGSVTTPGSGLDNLVISAITDDGATLTWDNGDATNQVRIQYRLNDTGGWTTASTEPIGTTTYALTGLAAASLYGVRVVLWDGVAEVGTALTGTFTTVTGAISSLVVGTPAASSVGLTWTTTDTSLAVRVERRLSGSSAYGVVAVLPAGSDRYTLTGLAPSTAYDVRVTLVSGAGVPVGTALTDTFTTAAASATLQPPTSPTVFAGFDPVANVVRAGSYGIRLSADTTNPPHALVIEEAVETAVSSGTPGSYSEVDTIPASFSGPTYWVNTAPNDGKLRWLRAKARLAGYTDSATTTALSVDPWGTTTLPGLTLLGALDDLSDVDTTGKADGDVLTWDAGTSTWIAAPPTTGGGGTRVVGATFDGAGSVLDLLGATECVVEVPASGTISGWTVVTRGGTGSVTIGVERATYSAFPTFTDLTGGADVVVSSATKGQDTTLSGWTTTLTAGDILRFSLVSVSTFTHVTLTLTYA